MNFQVPSIGLPKEKFQELKIKDNVDHVGLLVPQVLLNHGLFYKEEVLT
jgi:hypothetical protein